MASEAFKNYFNENWIFLNSINTTEERSITQGSSINDVNPFSKLFNPPPLPCNPSYAFFCDHHPLWTKVIFVKVQSINIWIFNWVSMSKLIIMSRQISFLKFGRNSFSIFFRKIESINFDNYKIVVLKFVNKI